MRFKRFFVSLLALALCLCAPAYADYDMPYYIEVDITNQIVTVYNTADGSIARQMLCSTGMNDSTPEGTFHLTEKGRVSERGEWTWFQQYHCWVKYATRIYHGYMFHSLPFSEKDESTMIEESANEFGMPTSHGCIRLRVDDARFIAKECLVGTAVKIYKKDEKEEELRQLLLVSSYVAGEGMTYAEFLGYSENALSRDSTGTEVSDLQHRLADLGYYDGAAEGHYDTETIAAVKKLQRDLGLAENGISTEQLLEVIYSENAPVSAGQTTLTEGCSGPVVKKFQSALQTLGVYEGELDSVYDLEVSQAVRLLQSACGYEADGIATPELQQAAYYLIGQLEATFGADAIPAAERVTEEIQMARLDSENNIIIRSKPSTDGENLGKLRDGDAVLLGETQDGWTQISFGGVDGYVMSKYLEPYAEENVILKFTAADGTSYQIGRTAEEYRADAQSVADVFSSLYASGQYAGTQAETVIYATVTTGAEGVSLNLRAQADGESEILAQVPNGTNLRVLARESGYAQVGFDEQIGYLLEDYLSFWEGDAADVESTEQPKESAASQLDLEAEDSIYAVVVCTDEDGSAAVYAAGSADAERLGSLPAGTEVEVVELGETDDWVLIRCEGREGYMLDANLQFQLM